MTFKKCILYITLYFSTVGLSLKCFLCNNPKDKLCNSPKENNCSENQNFCYVMNYTSSKLNEKWVLKGCTDKCSENSSVSNETNKVLESSFEKTCCEGSLCNGLKQEKTSEQNVENTSNCIANNNLIVVVAFYVSLLVA